MLMNGLNGGLVGGIIDVNRNLISSIRLDMSCVCCVNVLHWPSRRNLVRVCGHSGPILKDCLNVRKLDESSNLM
jgi:hypothetical protein